MNDGALVIDRGPVPPRLTEPNPTLPDPCSAQGHQTIPGGPNKLSDDVELKSAFSSYGSSHGVKKLLTADNRIPKKGNANTFDVREFV